MEDYFEKKKKIKILKRCLFKVNNLVNDLRIWIYDWFKKLEKICLEI